MAFQVGDLVTAMPLNDYVVTNENGIYKVMQVDDHCYMTAYGYGNIVIEVIEHDFREDLIGHQYRVESCYFNVVKQKESPRSASFTSDMFD